MSPRHHQWASHFAPSPGGGGHLTFGPGPMSRRPRPSAWNWFSRCTACRSHGQLDPTGLNSFARKKRGRLKRFKISCRILKCFYGINFDPTRSVFFIENRSRTVSIPFHHRSDVVLLSRAPYEFLSCSSRVGFEVKAATHRCGVPKPYQGVPNRTETVHRVHLKCAVLGHVRVFFVWHGGYVPGMCPACARHVRAFFESVGCCGCGPAHARGHVPAVPTWSGGACAGHVRMCCPLRCR